MWEALLIIVLGVAVLVVLFFAVLAYLDGLSLRDEFEVEKKKKRKKVYPKCTCVDVNFCDTYCIAKKNFTKAHGFK